MGEREGCPAWTTPEPCSYGSGHWAIQGPPRGKRGLRQGPQGCANTAQLFFGEGSRLTVLGKEAVGAPERSERAGWAELSSCPTPRGAVLRGAAGRLGRGLLVLGAGRAMGLSAVGRTRAESGIAGRAAPVFVLGLQAVSTDPQYFGPGTRLTVLGKRGLPRKPGNRGGRGHSRASFCAASRGCEPKHSVLRRRDPALSAG